MISLGLRTTASQNRREMLKLIIDQLEGIGGARPIGFGPLRVASLPDAVAGALQEHYFPQEQVQQLNLPIGPQATPVMPETDVNAEANGHVQGVISGADLCPECGTYSLVRIEGCRKCGVCGYSEC